LSQIGERATLRYAVQLLTPANIIARMNGRTSIAAGDIDEVKKVTSWLYLPWNKVDNLFFDAKSSAKLLAEQVCD